MSLNHPHKSIVKNIKALGYKKAFEMQPSFGWSLMTDIPGDLNRSKII